MTLIEYLREKWLKYTPLFVCKELRKQKQEQIAEFERKREYVEKHELFFTFKGFFVISFSHNPKYKAPGDELCLAYIQDNSGHNVTSYCTNKTEIEAKYDAIQKYYRTCGRTNV